MFGVFLAAPERGSPQGTPAPRPLEPTPSRLRSAWDRGLSQLVETGDDHPCQFTPIIEIAMHRCNRKVEIIVSRIANGSKKEQLISDVSAVVHKQAGNFSVFPTQARPDVAQVILAVFPARDEGGIVEAANRCPDPWFFVAVGACFRYFQKVPGADHDLISTGPQYWGNTRIRSRSYSGLGDSHLRYSLNASRYSGIRIGTRMIRRNGGSHSS